MKETDMTNLSQKMNAYFEKLEAERCAALAMSKDKAEEAKLIEARQQGFQEALELLGVQTADAESELRDGEAPKSARAVIYLTSSYVSCRSLEQLCIRA